MTVAMVDTLIELYTAMLLTVIFLAFVGAYYGSFGDKENGSWISKKLAKIPIDFWKKTGYWIAWMIKIEIPLLIIGLAVHIINRG